MAPLAQRFNFALGLCAVVPQLQKMSFRSTQKFYRAHMSTKTNLVPVHYNEHWHEEASINPGVLEREKFEELFTIVNNK